MQVSAALPSGTLRPHVLLGGYALQCANQAAISDSGHADKLGWGTPNPCNPLNFDRFDGGRNSVSGSIWQPGSAEVIVPYYDTLTTVRKECLLGNGSPGYNQRRN